MALILTPSWRRPASGCACQCSIAHSHNVATGPRRRSGGGPCFRNCSVRHSSRAGWRASTAAAPVDLDSLIPFASMASGKCAYIGSGQTQCSLQGDLARSAAEEVGTAHDVRDALSRIVDDDRQLICEQAVAAADDEVTRIAGKIRCLQSLQLVVECDRAGRDPEADRERPVRRPHSVATPTGVVQLVGLSRGRRAARPEARSGCTSREKRRPAASSWSSAA